jgi:uncharacterized protein (DUF983 family)
MGTNVSMALAVLVSLGGVGLLTLVGAYLGIEIAWNESPKPGLEPRDLVRRALACKCPACGVGRLFQSRFKMNAECSNCRIIFWQSEGEYLGPMVIDYSVALAAALVVWAITLFLNSSQTTQICLVAAVAIASMMMIARWSRSFWAAFLYVTGEMKPREFQ